MTIFSLLGEILIKDNGAKQKLEEIEGAGSKTGSTLDGAFSKIGGALLKLGAVVGVSLGFKSLFDKASVGQQTMAQMDAVLKSTGGSAGMTKDALINLADAQSKVTTFSTGTTRAAENLLLTFTGVGKDVFPATIKAAQDMSIAMGTDLNSSVMTLGKALNDPAEGLTRLTKQGVTFTAAQKEQITAMEKAGNVAGAQGIILQELQKEFGGSADAAGKTFAGQLTILRNQLTGVGIGIVSKLLPPLTTLVTAINNHMPQIQAVVGNVINFIGSAIDALMPTFEGIINDVIKIAENIFPSLGGSSGNLGKQLVDLAKGGLNIVKDVLDWIAQHGEVVRAAIAGVAGAFAGMKIAGVVSSITKMVSGAKNLVNGFKTLKAAGANAGQIMRILFGLNPMTLGLMVGIAALAIIAYEVITHWTQVKTFFINLWTGVKQKFTEFWNWLKSFMAQWGPVILAVIAPFIGIPLLIAQHWEQIKTFFSDLWNSITSTAVSGWNSFWSSVGSILNSIGNGIKNIWNGILSWFESLPSRLYNAGSSMFNSLKSGISSVLGTIGSVVQNGFNSAINFITSLPSKALKWGEDFIDGLVNGIKGKIGKVEDAVSGVADKISSFLHFSVPDEGPLTKYESWMPDFMEGLTKGIESNKHLVTNAIKNLATDVNVGMKLNPSITDNGGDLSGKNENSKNQGNTIINFNGSYSFSDKKDIDYFMNQAALLVNRRK